ncbi:hypothetical protein [Georgenia muralis]|uniref:Immune inhibitor A peptidase M6 n=1 Tax=Georgenia muralis TaxID=154117 RepID=A0A3N4Z754_9MICO|nr:hypothetical protein [Georgenia muralis]RPF27000.1 hypothetical protein EDD32_1460 [Georgenia muralis]
MAGLAAPAMAAHPDTPPADYGTAGDDTIIVPVNDSAAGGTYYQPFERAYAGATEDGTPVYVYVPVGALEGVDGVHSLDPAFDHNPDDEFVPCAENSADDYVLTQGQVDYIGDALADQILAVNEEHFGDLGAAASGSDALVTLVYNVQDDSYYDCTVSSYTAGYFAPEYLSAESLGMNVMVLDAFDWANRVGEDPDAAPWSDGDPANDRPELYEGVVAHELEHMLMNYSDAGELSWVDEGLADMAAFLNGYDMTGSHLTYQQVFHRETSLTRWGGGLENYGASFSYFLYLWEQAGGNGDGSLEPDLVYDDTAGDLLIKLIFAEQADGMVGVQNAIDAYNAETGDDLASAEELFKDWAVAMKLDDEGSSRWDLENFDLGADSGGWTIDLANDVFWDDRGSYRGAQPDAKWDRLKNRPGTTALPFGVSYETFRNPGPQVSLEFDGEATTTIEDHSGDGQHWWAGYESQTDHVLGLDAEITGGETVTFWNWHFIEEGWDYGFVEALVGGDWVTLEVTLAGSDPEVVVSTDEDPHGNNTEGNGITGTSGGVYFVDEPAYVQYEVTVPDGATDVQFRYSTDAAYLDTGWFIDEIAVDGMSARVTPEIDPVSEEPDWVLIEGKQINQWVVQVISTCDLTPGVDSAFEITDDADNYVYRFEGDTNGDISTGALDTRCANGNTADFFAVISNLATGELTVLDADYDFDVVNLGAKGRR